MTKLSVVFLFFHYNCFFVSYYELLFLDTGDLISFLKYINTVVLWFTALSNNTNNLI